MLVNNIAVNAFDVEICWLRMYLVTEVIKARPNVDIYTNSNCLQCVLLGGLSLHLNHLIGIAHDKLRLAIWDTSFWTFWLKFGHKGPWDIS